jgi:hypothetical protein
MDMAGGNPPTWCSPYNNPDLEYVYLVSLHTYPVSGVWISGLPTNIPRLPTDPLARPCHVVRLEQPSQSAGRVTPPLHSNVSTFSHMKVFREMLIVGVLLRRSQRQGMCIRSSRGSPPRLWPARSQGTYQWAARATNTLPRSN